MARFLFLRMHVAKNVDVAPVRQVATGVVSHINAALITQASAS